MTGEKIRIAFCRGEIFAKDIFLASDDAPEPLADYGDIRVYIQEDSDGVETFTG